MNKVFKALSDPTRRRVLALLRNGPQSAGELADHFDVSKPTMSAHFAVLREAELIDSTKQGTTVMYALKLSVLEDALHGFAELLGIQAKKPEGEKRGKAAPPTREVKR
jgi:DNA-binding transcriptional ArsR family regulator